MVALALPLVEERSDITIVERSGPQHHHNYWYTEQVYGYVSDPINFDEALLTGQIPIPYGVDPDLLEVSTWYEGAYQCFSLVYIASAA